MFYLFITSAKILNLIGAGWLINLRSISSFYANF